MIKQIISCFLTISFLVFAGCGTDEPASVTENDTDIYQTDNDIGGNDSSVQDDEIISDIDTANDLDDLQDNEIIPDIDTDPGSVITVQITKMASGVVEKGASVTFEGLVSDDRFTSDQLDVAWNSDIDGILWQGKANTDGTVSFTTDTLSAGIHMITLKVTNPDSKSASISRGFNICEWTVIEDFNTDVFSSGWKKYGDAYWDENGWLEMTGNVSGKKGQIFYIAKKLTTSDTGDSESVSIKVKVRTGPNTGTWTGADGFAMSVVNVQNVTELEKYIATTHPGYAMGYGVETPDTVKAFHIEFDIWDNYEYRDEPEGEPTGDHIGVMLDGDAVHHKLYAKIPELEDMQWHDIFIRIKGESIIVYIDGKEVINGTIEGFVFGGGYIGFSGSTGEQTNYHSFDDLRQCLIPQN